MRWLWEQQKHASFYNLLLLTYPTAERWGWEQPSKNAVESCWPYSNFRNKHVSCLQSVFCSVEVIVYDSVTKHYSGFLEKWLIKLFIFSCWKLFSEREFIVFPEPREVMCKEGGSSRLKAFQPVGRFPSRPMIGGHNDFYSSFHFGNVMFLTESS